MKSTLITCLLAASLFNFTSAQTKKEQDKKSIKDMCGCYEVKFNFTETFSYSKDSTYYPSETKHDAGLEWVQLVEDSEDKISMQHLLLVGGGMIVKHWRQDWLFENTNLYEFHKDNTWKFTQLSPEEVEGQWTQKVYQVDDSPRYEGTGSWVHVDGKHYWVNTTDAPLPRREYTKRHDYNVLNRRNIHAITDFGWTHEQDNKKIVRSDDAEDVLLAEEKGFDVYTKVDDSKCKDAQKYWAEYGSLWKNVRARWEKIYAKNQDLALEKVVEGKPLYKFLFALEPDAKKKTTDKIIDSFVK
ncbi:hypothetical protein SAMN05216480_101721 [Pustulibacterium marinum]|uniref:DKNYY family protein n=1 Tax=Pustulibacterium marinum TaxID=1224947 RepID=A0A1I7F7R9_9FLAO|nr:DUF6607 family protein [Pustulibacterium marinum]SFU32263.1 hypothetical protein SAMN05216480_101721 [Pustulibacterium marinum]